MEVKPGLIKKTSSTVMQKEQKPAGMKQQDRFTYTKGTQEFDVVDVHSERDFPALGGLPQ